MSSIALSNPISTAITLPAADRIGYLDGLAHHFDRDDSTIGYARITSGSDHTLYMWPKNEPTLWTYALTTTNEPVSGGLTGFLDWGVDLSANNNLPEDPTTILSANRTPALTQHVQNVEHIKFLVHEYGDALFIQELVSENTSFKRHYHVGEIFAPAWTNASSLGIKGLGILGGVGSISTDQPNHAWLSAATTTQLASRIELKVAAGTGNSLWGRAGSFYSVNSTTAVSAAALLTSLSPVVCTGNDMSSGTNYLNLGFYKYLARFHTTRPPGTLLESSVDETAYVAINVSTGNTSHFARVQYGVAGIL